MPTNPSGWALILGSFLLAAWLSVLPLPQGWLWWRPAWVALLLLYWAVACPEQVGVGTAWLLGLCLDGLGGGVFGQQALSLSLIAYLCSLIYQRMRMFAMLQQVLMVFVLVGLHQLVYHWLHNLRGTAVTGLWYLLPAVMSALCWPVLLPVLAAARRAFMPVQRA